MRSQLLLSVSTVLLLAAGQAGAQTADPETESADEVEAIIVTALPLGRGPDDVTSNVALLSGDELVHRRQATLGETLNGIPGVSSDTFGGGASRPVVRGQTSPRVRVLSNGAALLDASEVSPDHAVSVEPLLVDGIEILRGPSALLYGGGAIGGAVNIIDRKIPVRPVEGVSGAAEVRAGTADDERTGVLGLTVGAGPFAFRLEALDRRSSDYDVPSYEPPHHEHEDGEEEEEHEHEEEGPFDTLAGSFNDTRTLSLGGAWTGANGFFGLAYTDQRSDYGLPGHSHEYEGCHPHGVNLHCGAHDDEDEDHDHDHEDHDHVPPTVDLRSQRVDARGELRDLSPWIEKLSFRGGYTDYAHDEKEGDEVSTTFMNEGYDGRVELQHARIGGWRGVVGAQGSRSDFAAIGEEAFLPESRIENRAIFAMEEYELGAFRFEIAARQEWQDAQALGRPNAGHEPFSISGGVVFDFMPGWSLAGSVSRSERAPTAQELYADGVHLATNTYEIGAADLDVEAVAAQELTLRKTEGDTRLTLGVYRYDYDGYIYAETLDRFEDFRLIRYGQTDAEFTGLEAEIHHDLTPWLSVELFGDAVRGKLSGGAGNAPRIPAGRLGARAEFVHDAWSGDVELHHVFDQDDVAAFETETPGYDMLNLTVARDFTIGDWGAQVYLRGNNLLDEVALNHASFLADVAPLRGRNLVVGVRATF